jgi:hypothetical protein
MSRPALVDAARLRGAAVPREGGLPPCGPWGTAAALAGAGRAGAEPALPATEARATGALATGALATEALAAGALTTDALAGGNGRLLAIVPIDDGGARLAIVGYVLPPSEPAEPPSSAPSLAPVPAVPGGLAAGTAPAAGTGLVVDAARHQAVIRGRDLGLAHREFELLAFLAQHPGQVFSRTQLLTQVWRRDRRGGTRTVDIHVHRIRRKLGAEYARCLVTIRHVGYLYQPAAG